MAQMARKSSPRSARRPRSRPRGAGGRGAGARPRRAIGSPLVFESEPEEAPLVLNAPLMPLWKDSPGGEFKVPTVALNAEATLADGRRFRGRIFLPTAAHDHTGSMRAEEWMNDGVDFFPFLLDDASAPVLLNKREIVALTVPASADRDRTLEAIPLPQRRLALECGSRRFEGTIVIDMPENHSRVLDYLNRPGAFLTLREKDRHHLVAKGRITRVTESREGS
jgi:hypothetical protein